MTLDREAEREYIFAKRVCRNADLVEVAKFWANHHPADNPKKVAALIADFLAWVGEFSGDSRHVRDLRNRPNGPFKQNFGERYPETITRSEIVLFLKNRQVVRKSDPNEIAQELGVEDNQQSVEQRASGRTILNERNTLTNFFNFLVSKELVKMNPASGIRRRDLPKVDIKEIRFLTLEEVERYLRALERYEPDLVAHEIVQLLAGVRADDEMADFSGDFVHENTREMVIPADIAKTQKREIISDLEPCFWEWWKKYGRRGLLRPKNYEPRWSRVRVLASVTNRREADKLAILPIKTLLARAESKAVLVQWP